MDCPRDLGQVELWQESLERSLVRRGRPKRSSVELHRLRGERDLTREDVLLESAQYSQLRRRAAEHPLVPRPAAAIGGVSALTLLAVTTLPGLFGGRTAQNQRVTYAAKVLSVSESVRQLQQRLGVVADGEFGPITLRAVEGFQASHGLVVDGIVGPATRAALGLPAGPILRANPIYFPKDGYMNPLAEASVTPERIDQGVDYAGTGTLTSIGEARVTYVGTTNTGWPGAFIEYQLLNGPDAGRYVYCAEGVRPAGGIYVGRVLQPGQAVAYLIPGWPTGIEIGWGAGIGTATLAWKLGEHVYPTSAGENFSALIASLGGPPGIP